MLVIRGWYWEGIKGVIYEFKPPNVTAAIILCCAGERAGCSDATTCYTLR